MRSTLVLMALAFALIGCGPSQPPSANMPGATASSGPDAAQANAPARPEQPAPILAANNDFGPWQNVPEAPGLQIRRAFALERAIAGKQFRYLSSYSSGSGGGMSTDVGLTFCPDGSFQSYNRSNTTIYVEGMSASDPVNRTDAGTFQVFEASNGKTLLALSSNGQSGFAAFQIEQGALLMANGNRYRLVGQAC